MSPSISGGVAIVPPRRDAERGTGGEAGFTIVEVLVAIVVLTIGLLGLMSTSALVTGMIARGQRSAMASVYASRRVEQLRATGCRTRTDGSETIYRGSIAVGRTEWRWSTAGEGMYRVTLQTTHNLTGARQRSETMEIMISCVR